MCRWGSVLVERDDPEFLAFFCIDSRGPGSGMVSSGAG